MKCFALLLMSSLTLACGTNVSSSGAASATGAGGSHAGTGGSHAGGGGSGAGGHGAGVPAGDCRSVSDCDNGDFCALRDLPPFCGGVCDHNFTNDCQTDADCADAGAGLICDLPCRCQAGGAQPGPHCTKGCESNGDCGPSKVCGPTHRCAAKACSGQSDCSGNFDCSGGTCLPRQCTSDGDCADHCVDGACTATFGVCELAVP